MASTSEDIQAVFNEDIHRKSLSVFNKSGIAPFYDGFRGFSIEDLSQLLGVDKIVCCDYTPKKPRKLNKKQQVDLEE